ncbi:hypothetical protein [Aeromicrobium sp.]|uniref:hypothetical protein n=1 Tax=Aeromicrobium sp. TaxID=1871063 RepID=UPI0025C4FC93|nr:hypothetical protein [Aeromicrobium sp.]MCK5892262.1 hypothetical protein [Aeromicrobium sp.]
MGTGVRSRVLSVALLVVAVVFFLDQLLEIDWPEGALWPLRIVLLVAAVVVAGIAYAGWSAGEPAATRPLVAMITSLIGGACLASAVTSADDGTVFGSSSLASVAVVAITFGVVTFNLAARETPGA